MDVEGTGKLSAGATRSVEDASNETRQRDATRRHTGELSKCVRESANRNAESQETWRLRNVAGFSAEHELVLTSMAASFAANRHQRGKKECERPTAHTGRGLRYESSDTQPPFLTAGLYRKPIAGLGKRQEGGKT